jgi:uncharacterized damage-inducible protein DinB
MNTTTEAAVQLAVAAWHSQNKRMDTLLSSLTDEQLMKEIAPGKNRGIYLLGHLTAVSDGILPLLNLGQRLYPQLDDAFIKNPDKSDLPMPTISELKEYWNTVNKTLSNHFAAMQYNQWLDKHTAVSAEDFEKEPHRNKLNLLLNRTNHQSYHMGQLALLK